MQSVIYESKCIMNIYGKGGGGWEGVKISNLGKQCFDWVL